MANIIFHAAAAVDYEDAYAWYYGRSEQAAEAFEEAIAQALQKIRQQPEQGLPFGRLHRCIMVKRFPYHIVYRIDRDPILVVAVAHGRRRPRYWKNRR